MTLLAEPVRPTPDDILRFRQFGFGPAASPEFRMIHHAFEAQARLRPDAIAVTHQGESLSYRELNDRADRLAATLIGCGVRPGDRVGLFLRRGIPMVTGILAVLKAGAAYVPQDARITPPEHLAHIIRAAGIQVVLTLTEFTSTIPAADTVLRLDQDLASEEPRAIAQGSSDATAVVIFTSGTTGRPNGVAVTHRNLCNVLLTEPGSLGIRPGHRVGQILNVAFDMAVWEILGALSHGATLVIRDRDTAATVRGLDVVIATPGILGRLDPRECRRVEIAAVAGERCPQVLADTWASFSAFHNACGPTEVTIVNTVQRHRIGEPVSIGRPVPNTSVYLLDDDLRPVSIGAIGEMWAGGACVTAGYLGNDLLTAERYRPDPFAGGLMFRTRDLARWTPDGRLEHHGRTDDQVKVRGFRVELDAVTAALESTPGCRQATTVLRDGRLVGFVTGADPDQARQAVARRLPYYCVPSEVLAVDTLPMTDRGKVDRRALLGAVR